MPHVILEYSEKLLSEKAASQLVSKLISELSQIETFNIAAIKGRASSYSCFQVADGQAAKDFLHAEIALLENRPESVFVAVADRLDGVLRAGLAQKNVEISLEVREMSSKTYRK